MLSYLSGYSATYPDRSQYPADKIAFVTADTVTELNGQISETITENEGVTQIIDKRVSVWTPVDQTTRAKIIKQWNQLAERKYAEAFGSAAVAAASGIAGSCSVFPFVTWPICAISTVNTVVALAQGIDANFNAARWANPVPRLAFIRQECGRIGFQKLFELSRHPVNVTEDLRPDLKEIVCNEERETEWAKSAEAFRKRHGIDPNVGIFWSEHPMLKEFFVEWSPLSSEGIKLGVMQPSSDLVKRGHHFDWFRERLSENVFVFSKNAIQRNLDKGIATLEKHSQKRLEEDYRNYRNAVDRCKSDYEAARNRLPAELQNDHILMALRQNQEKMLSDFKDQHVRFCEAEENFLRMNKEKLGAEAAGQLLQVQARQTVANTAMIRAMRLLSDPNASLQNLQEERYHFEQRESLYCLESTVQSLLQVLSCPAPVYVTQIAVTIYDTVPGIRRYQ